MEAIGGVIGEGVVLMVAKVSDISWFLVGFWLT